MNPETETTEIKKHPVFQVTQTSKYLAMLLFIAMPFIGGWIGYSYAPVKIMYVNTIVPAPAKNFETQTSQPNTLPTKLSDILHVGKEIGGMTVAEYSPFDSDYSEVDFNNVKMLLKGPLEVTGTFEYVVYEIGFEGYCMKDFSEETIARLPYIPMADGTTEPRTWFCFRNEDKVLEELGKDKKVVTVLIDSYELNAFPSEVVDRADLISVLE